MNHQRLLWLALILNVIGLSILLASSAAGAAAPGGSSTPAKSMAATAT